MVATTVDKSEAVLVAQKVARLVGLKAEKMVVLWDSLKAAKRADWTAGHSAELLEWQLAEM